MTQNYTEVVDPVRFVQATRDSGYRNVASALSELVDNSLQAGADRVAIFVDDSDGGQIAVLDNGSGMVKSQLRNALQFGGSHRFDDRTGMGRFGMGLPNSSLSQARRVDVFTWKHPRVVWQCHLDLDEILAQQYPVLSTPCRSRIPAPFRAQRADTGTLVIWSNLDRGKPSSWKTLTKRIETRLGQMFRYFLWSGRAITVNGSPVTPNDPLFLSTTTRTPWIQASTYGEALTYNVDLGRKRQATITVRFTELPVQELSHLSNGEKRQYGLSNGAGVSIVRAGREIDYGWFLMTKRRENYDDWWRCEIQFTPELDEMFGVTHIKQGIRPTDQLCGMMSNELSTIARTLNHRVRMAHVALSAQQQAQAAAVIASGKDRSLRPVDLPTVALNAMDYASLTPAATDGNQKYRLVTEKIDARVFCRTEVRDGQITLVVNTHHEFFLNVYQPLLQDDHLCVAQHRKQLELMLLALGRSTLLERPAQDQAAIQDFIVDWSRAIAVFNGRSSHGA